MAARARELDRLSERIVPLLPEPLRGHAYYASLRNDRILLLVESPAWAARARMDQARILAAVRGIGLAAASVAARVVPRTVPVAGTAGAKRPLSRGAASTIRTAAGTIADPDLREAFLALAATSTQPERD